MLHSLLYFEVGRDKIHSRMGVQSVLIDILEILKSRNVS
jgi:hypothetical protein